MTRRTQQTETHQQCAGCFGVATGTWTWTNGGRTERICATCAALVQTDGAIGTFTPDAPKVEGWVTESGQRRILPGVRLG